MGYHGCLPLGGHQQRKNLVDRSVIKRQSGSSRWKEAQEKKKNGTLTLSGTKVIK